MIEAHNNVPVFGLYGESSASPEPGHIHIEDVEARSRSLAWRIAPHRHAGLYQIICVFDGNMDIQLNEQSATVERCGLATIPAGSVHGFRFSPDAQGDVLTIATPLFSRAPFAELRSTLSVAVEQPWIVDLQALDGLVEQLRGHFARIKAELAQARPGFETMMEWEAGAALLLLARHLSTLTWTANAGLDSSRIVTGFSELLEAKFREGWRVSDYARALHTSVSTLTRYWRRSTGVTVQDAIHNRLMLEARRKLRYTRQPVEQIARQLGFADAAYFSRFFKARAGQPPSRFRASQA